jgi:hypothetical protein
LINATLLADNIVAVKHPNAGVTLKSGRNTVTLTGKEFAALVSFLVSDEIPPVSATPVKARWE